LELKSRRSRLTSRSLSNCRSRKGRWSPTWKDSPAGKAGVERGDIIIEFNHTPVQDVHQLPELVAQTPIGSTADMVVIHNGKRLRLKIKIGELKDEQLASAKSEEPGSNWGLQVQSIPPEIANQPQQHQGRGGAWCATRQPGGRGRNPAG
jgi:hypothetical protein